MDLGSFEEDVLLAVLGLGDDAYSVPIRQQLEDASKRTVAIGAVYTTLERLETKGFVQSKLGPPLEERGGRSRKYYTVTGTGQAAIDRRDNARLQLRTLKTIGGAA